MIDDREPDRTSQEDADKAERLERMRASAGKQKTFILSGSLKRYVEARSARHGVGHSEVIRGILNEVIDHDEMLAAASLQEPVPEPLPQSPRLYPQLAAGKKKTCLLSPRIDRYVEDRASGNVSQGEIIRLMLNKAVDREQMLERAYRSEVARRLDEDS